MNRLPAGLHLLRLLLPEEVWPAESPGWYVCACMCKYVHLCVHKPHT